MAKANAEANGVAGRMTLLQADLLDGVPHELDFIVSNPPYIDSGAIGLLEPEVRAHDPLLALDGGSDGLAFYRRLVAQAATRVVAGGMLHLEVGSGQAAKVAALAQASGWRIKGIHADMAGIDRVVSAQRGGAA